MNEVRQQKFTPTRQGEIKRLVSFIRTRNGGNNRTNRNVIFHSARTGQDPYLARLYNLLTRDLPASILSKVQNTRLYLRYMSGGAHNYALLQRLHRNVISRINEGDAFVQFLYYIDTPKIGNVNAPPNQRGSLILNPTPNVAYTFTPEQGRIVFFNPSVTYHEVSAPVGNLAGNVNRNMVIGFLFTEATHMNNANNTNKQNKASSPYAEHVRALAAAGRNQIPYLASKKTSNRSVMNNRKTRFIMAKHPTRANTVALKAKIAINRRRARSAAVRTAARRKLLNSKRHT